MIVIDASAAVRAATKRRGFASLIKHAPVAPPLLWSEVTSALRQAVWRGEISEEKGQACLSRFQAAYIDRRLPDTLYQEAWTITAKLGWAKCYDAEYVALARLLDCRLLTTDARLHRGASRIVQVIGPSDL